MLISIVIPVFNAEKSIGPLVKSILEDPQRQTPQYTIRKRVDLT